jgi:N-hydroxyarylamine O-acetyltransferase
VSQRIDIDAYFDRIAYAGAREPDLATLRALHALHPAAIAFENLDVLMGRGVSLDVARLERKLVGERRGGYCFEQNRLFATVLQQLGYEVTGLAARVLWGRTDDAPRPRTHMLLGLRLGAERYIADVGFGGLTLSGPLLLEPDVEQTTPHETFRLRQDGDAYTVEARLGDQWRPLYRFDLQPQQPVDFEVLSHYVSTHPASHFRTTLMAAKRTSDGRYALSNNRLQIFLGETLAERRVFADAKELRVGLERFFSIDVPHGPAADAALAACFR